MTKQTLGWVDRARPLADYSHQTSIFSLTKPELTRERSYDRTLLRFTAQGERHLPDAGLELSNVAALLLDADGAPIVRRGHESGRQTLLGPLTTWAHELYDDQLAISAALLYEVELRVDHRRMLLEAELGAVDLDADDRRPWPLTVTAGSADPLLDLSLRTTYNRGDFEICLVGEATDLHDGHRHDFELDLRDEHGRALASRAMSLGIGAHNLGVTDYSMRLEKKVARAVRKLTLRCRSEVRAIARLGPFQLAGA